MKHVYGRRRLDKTGSTPLQGRGKCQPCKDGNHKACLKTATDEMTGDRVSCYCAGLGHRTDNDWRRIFR